MLSPRDLDAFFASRVRVSAPEPENHVTSDPPQTSNFGPEPKELSAPREPRANGDGGESFSLARAAAPETGESAQSLLPSTAVRALSGLTLPEFVVAAPWEHQLEGIEFALAALDKYNAVLLAAQMGVGKTLISLLSAILRGARRILIVAPKRVISAWQEQLPLYLKHGSYVLAALDDKAGSCAERAELAQEKEDRARVTNAVFVCIVNYDAFWREPLASHLRARRFDAVIYDESHRLKSPGGKASRFAHRLHSFTRDRILASGTPMAHSPLDMYGQFRAAAPFVFGTNYAAFRTQYAKLGGPERQWVIGYQNIDDLERRMAPLTWRKTKAEVLSYLPEQTDVEYSTELSPDAAKIYRQLDKDFFAEIEGSQITVKNVLSKILRLQQVTGGALPTDDGEYHVVDSSKKQLLSDTLEDLDEPVVIFARFKSDIAACHEAAQACGYETFEISGRANDYTVWKQRARDFTESTQSFIEQKAPALIVQIQSGSEGISLVEASTAIYYSLTPRLIEYDQSRSRLHRPGQRNAVTYIYLTVKGSIDQKILAALRQRQDFIETIMSRVARRRAGSESEA